MAVHIILLSILPLFISSTKATSYISLTTPRQSGPESGFTFTLLSEHGYNIDSTESIIFEVKACYDACVGLMETNDTNTALYNVVMGGWGNTKSVLYRKKQERPHLIEHNGVLLNCGSLKKFNVKWTNGKIELWRMDGNSSWIKTLSYSTPDTSRIKFIGVSTSIWANGEWKIFIQETTEEPNTAMQQVSWRQDRNRKDQTFTSPKYTIRNHMSRIDCLQQCQMHRDCRYVTYNTTQCHGFSEINSSLVVSRGTSMWVRP